MVEKGSEAENLDILFRKRPAYWFNLLCQITMKKIPNFLLLWFIYCTYTQRAQAIFSRLSLKKCFCATLEPLKILSKVFNSSKAFFSAFLNKIILPLTLLGVPVHILYWPYVVVFLLQFYTECISVCESILFLDQHCIRVWFKKEFLHFFCSSRTDDLGQ